MLKRLDLPPVWGAATFVAIWFLARTVEIAPAPPFAAPLGVALMALGAGFILWAALHFLRAKTPIEPRRTPRALITTGPFRLTRNPIYRGMVWASLGFCLAMGELSALVFPGLYAWALNSRFIAPEEQTLRAAFGAEFDAWADRVRARL